MSLTDYGKWGNYFNRPCPFTVIFFFTVWEVFFGGGPNPLKVLRKLKSFSTYLNPETSEICDVSLGESNLEEFS